MAQSTGSLDSEDQDPLTVVQDTKVVDKMQAELSNIVESQPDRSSLFSSTSSKSLFGDDTPPMVIPARTSTPVNRDRPSIASLGLIDQAPKRGVFEDDLFGDNTPRFAADDASSQSEGHNSEDEIHEAAPGDLGLAEAIDTLTGDIEKLVAQENVVDQLTKKAELTNNAAELRILRKSKASLQREISRKELQRQQYIVQEGENSLYGRADVVIKSVMVGVGDDGKEFAMCKSPILVILNFIDEC